LLTMDQSTLSGPAVSDTYPREATAIYHPLRANETHFLKLFPATSWDDEIHSDLIYVSLDDDDDSNTLSSCQALSYTWGTRDLAHGIWIKNSKCKVIANLFQALLRLRDKTTTRTLWIDAICL
jgi:hypothetical protein